MGKYYTCMTNLGVSNAFVTFTHSLSIAPANLVARPIIHQAGATCTMPLIVGTIGTNIITVGGAVNSLTTFDLEIQQVHSLIK